MDEIEELLHIEQELEQINRRLMKLFPREHPRFNDVFEDKGAAGYYIQESIYCIKAVIRAVQDDEDEE